MDRALKSFLIIALAVLSQCASTKYLQVPPAPEELHIFLEVISHSPDKNAENIPTITKVTATFKKIGNPIKTTGKTVCILKSLDNEVVDCEIKCSQNTLSLIPKERLKPDTKYYVLIANLEYDNGEKISGAITWVFKTRKQTI